MPSTREAILAALLARLQPLAAHGILADVQHRRNRAPMPGCHVPDDNRGTACRTRYGQREILNEIGAAARRDPGDRAAGAITRDLACRGFA